DPSAPNIFAGIPWDTKIYLFTLLCTCKPRPTNPASTAHDSLQEHEPLCSLDTLAVPLHGNPPTFCDILTASRVNTHGPTHVEAHRVRVAGLARRTDTLARPLTRTSRSPPSLQSSSAVRCKTSASGPSTSGQPLCHDVGDARTAETAGSRASIVHTETAQRGRDSWRRQSSLLCDSVRLRAPNLDGLQAVRRPRVAWHGRRRSASGA
ncbi:hypothetical protein CERSUDRAFT_120312, partial [Gelatoporia subvermispora B]